MDQHSKYNCQKVEKKCNSQVFFLIGIDAKQDQQTNTGSVQQSGDQMADGQYAVQVHLRQQDRGTAVGNQADQAGEKQAADRSGGNSGGQTLLPQKEKGQIQNDRNDKYK